MAAKIPETFDVIVVLGAAQMPDGAPGPVIERRMAEAVRLWHEGRAPNLLVSGGATRLPTPEAETMAALAREHGVPADAIHLEARSTRTLENAVFAIEVMRRNGWRDALVVTDDFHMARAEYCFRALGRPVWPARVRNVMTRKIFLSWCREIVARRIYPRQVRAYQGKW